MKQLVTAFCTVFVLSIIYDSFFTGKYINIEKILRKVEIKSNYRSQLLPDDKHLVKGKQGGEKNSFIPPKRKVIMAEKLSCYFSLPIHCHFVVKLSHLGW